MHRGRWRTRPAQRAQPPASHILEEEGDKCVRMHRKKIQLGQLLRACVRIYVVAVCRFRDGLPWHPSLKYHLSQIYVLLETRNKRPISNVLYDTDRHSDQLTHYRQAYRGLLN